MAPGPIVVGLTVADGGPDNQFFDADKAIRFSEKMLLQFGMEERLLKQVESKTTWDFGQGKIKPLVTWGIR